jgi:hypothetical protein
MTYVFGVGVGYGRFCTRCKLLFAKTCLPIPERQKVLTMCDIIKNTACYCNYCPAAAFVAAFVCIVLQS